MGRFCVAREHAVHCRTGSLETVGASFTRQANSSLPYRQLRKARQRAERVPVGSLPYRQLRKMHEDEYVCYVCSLPYRQLRNAEALPIAAPLRSLPYRQLRKDGTTSRAQDLKFTAVQAA